jgi:hypothetical protein
MVAAVAKVDTEEAAITLDFTSSAVATRTIYRNCYLLDSGGGASADSPVYFGLDCRSEAEQELGEISFLILRFGLLSTLLSTVLFFLLSFCSNLLCSPFCAP